ncbi:hypothetical protein L7F22_061894 [Adiantum nelumboides]|nr:hypothetical protein [Adiantum nelumboides]
MAFPNFHGKKGENARNFLDDLEMAFLVSRRDSAKIKLRAFPLVLREEAKVWFQGLDEGRQCDWEVLKRAFLQRFHDDNNPEEIWRKLSQLQQASPDVYPAYEARFLKLWTQWEQILPEGERAPNFLQKERLKDCKLQFQRYMLDQSQAAAAGTTSQEQAPPPPPNESGDPHLDLLQRAYMNSPANIHSWLPCSPLGSGSARVSLPDALPFALKSPLSPSSPSLLNELLILLPLSSPFILRCLGADLAPSDPSPRHLFLEFMDGGSLYSLLKRSGGSLSELLVRSYVLSIVQGLKYLHLNGIVHCDIKAHNILIGSSGVKIADFGAAKRIGKGRVSKSEFRGTPLWMAPEVIQGVEQGFPSDIWSLGCTVVELLHGHPPWGHISDIGAALYKLGCSEEDPPLPEAISDDARDFLLHCLQRDPKARWTASELLQHPFLSSISTEKEAKHEQLSPRSTLELFRREESDSEDASTDLSWLGSQSVAKLPQPAVIATSSMKRHFADELNSEDHEWVTVKRAASCHREVRKLPFMKAGGPHVEVRRGCEVRLDSADFLQNRKIVG